MMGDFIPGNFMDAFFKVAAFVYLPLFLGVYLRGPASSRLRRNAGLALMGLAALALLWIVKP